MNPRRVAVALGCIGLVTLARADIVLPEDPLEGARALRESEREALTLERVREAIARSPNDWIAALAEVSDDSDCVGPQGGTCLLEIRVLEYLGGNVDRPADRRAGSKLRTVNARWPEPDLRWAVGRRRLVLAVPNRSSKRGYANAVLLVWPEAVDVERFRELMRQAVAR